MIFGIKEADIDDVVQILVRHLALSFNSRWDSEEGLVYWWCEEPNKLGFSYQEIIVRSSHYPDPETHETYLGNKDWEGYQVIILISDELGANEKVLQLIAEQRLAATEILPRHPVGR